MKFAEKLVEIETLLDCSFPIVVLYEDEASLQKWVALVVDENENGLTWLTFSITDDNARLVRSDDFAVAITLLQAIQLSDTIYRCSADTYDYGSILEGQKTSFEEEKLLPSEGSYVRIKAYLEWNAVQGENK